MSGERGGQVFHLVLFIVEEIFHSGNHEQQWHNKVVPRLIENLHFHFQFELQQKCLKYRGIYLCKQGFQRRKMDQ